MPPSTFGIAGPLRPTNSLNPRPSEDIPPVAYRSYGMGLLHQASQLLPPSYPAEPDPKFIKCMLNEVSTRTWHWAARYLHATLMSTSLDTLSCISSGTSIIPPGPMGSRGTEEDWGIPLPLPFALTAMFPIELPLGIWGSGTAQVVGMIENGRVRRRSAREYWWVIK